MPTEKLRNCTCIYFFGCPTKYTNQLTVTLKDFYKKIFKIILYPSFQ